MSTNVLDSPIIKRIDLNSIKKKKINIAILDTEMWAVN